MRDRPTLQFLLAISVLVVGGFGMLLLSRMQKDGSVALAAWLQAIGGFGAVAATIIVALRGEQRGAEARRATEKREAESIRQKMRLTAAKAIMLAGLQLEELSVLCASVAKDGGRFGNATPLDFMTINLRTINDAIDVFDPLELDSPNMVRSFIFIRQVGRTAEHIVTQWKSAPVVKNTSRQYFIELLQQRRYTKRWQARLVKDYQAQARRHSLDS